MKFRFPKGRRPASTFRSRTLTPNLDAVVEATVRLGLDLDLILAWMSDDVRRRLYRARPPGGHLDREERTRAFLSSDLDLLARIAWDETQPLKTWLLQAQRLACGRDGHEVYTEALRVMALAEDLL